MPIDINRNFIYLSATKAGVGIPAQRIGIPYPSNGEAAFQSEFSVTMQETANGEIRFQKVGRERDKQNAKWNVINPDVWWEMNQWILNNNNQFYCKYFSYNYGVWKTRKFYSVSPSCEPSNVDPLTGVPQIIKNASRNFIDMGVEGE